MNGRSRPAGGAMQDFTQGDIRAPLLRFAAPLFLSNILQAIYNMVDMVVVGQFVGKAGLSAVSIGGDLLNLLTFLAIGFSNAGQVILAQNLGAGRRGSLGRIAGNLLTLLLGSALVLTAVCFQLRWQLLRWMNTPPEAWDYALDYVTTCIPGLVCIYGYNVVSAVLRGLGDSRHPFMFIAAAAVLNLLLDLLFVAVFRMAAFGAALATVIGQGVSFFLGLGFLLRRGRGLGLRLTRDCFRPDRAVLGTLVRVGLPMAIKSASVTISKLFVDALVNDCGVVASSASGIESKLNVVSNLFSNAVNIGCSTMIGQNIGAEKYDRVPKIMRESFSINLLCALGLSAALLAAPRLVFGVFTADAEVIAVSMEMIPVLLLIFLGSAFRSPNSGLIDGSGNYRLNFVVALLDGIVNRIGFALLFGFALHMGWLGFLYGDAAAGFTPFLIGGVYYLSGKWRTAKYIIRGIPETEEKPNGRRQRRNGGRTGPEPPP